MIFKLIKNNNSNLVFAVPRKGPAKIVLAISDVAKYFKPTEDIVFVKATKTPYSFTIYKKLNPAKKKCQF